MATNSSGRKRQQRSKAGLQNKVSHADSQRNREQLNRAQRQQSSLNNNKSSQLQHLAETQKSQVQQQQQQETEQQNQQQQQQQQQQQPWQQHEASKIDSPTYSLLSKSRAKSLASQDKSKIGITEDPQVALQTAMFSRKYDVVENLLKGGVRFWDPDQVGNTAFLTACKLDDVHLMSIFWDASGRVPDLHHANSDGDTALHLCAKTGREDACKFLLSRGASLTASNKSGDTALHLAAHGDHVTICQTILNFIVSSSLDGNSNLHHYVLAENSKRQTPVCLSILKSHAGVTRNLLEYLPVKELADYLTRSFQRLLSQPHFTSFNHTTSSSIQEGNGTFLHGLLVSMSVLLIRLADKRRRENDQALSSNDNQEMSLEVFLADSDMIQSLVRIACFSDVSQQILTIACFLIVFLIEGISDREAISPTEHNRSNRCIGEIIPGDLLTEKRRKFTDQFLQCCGPDCLLLKLNNLEVTSPSYSAISMATVTPIMFLARSIPGRSWLETNKSHLTFLKELLLQNRSAFSLLTSTCPLLKLSFLESSCMEFIKLVEVLEDRDRETNLAELLWEEERDRMRRERKRHKRNQRKQEVGSQLKKEVALLPLQVSNVISEEDISQPYYDAHVNIWKLDAAFQEENNDTFGCKSNITKNSGDRKADYVYNQLRYEADKVGDTQVSGTEQALGVFSKDFSSITMSDSANRENLLVGEKQAWGGNIQTQEINHSDDIRSKYSGFVSKEIRWADVAKPGRRSWGEEFHYNQDNLGNGSQITIEKDSEFDEDAFHGFDKSKVFSVDKTEEREQGGAAGHETISNEWWSFINHNQSVNSSDDESSSSSSSTGSCSSLVSDSLLVRRKRTPMTESVPLETDLKQHAMAFGKRAAKNSKLQLMRKWKKQKNANSSQKRCKTELDADAPYIVCQSSVPEDGRDVSLISRDQILEVNSKGAFVLPTVGGSVVRSRSDDVLLELSRIPVDECKSTGKKEKMKGAAKKRVTKGPCIERMATQAKSGHPLFLPPLKLKENTGNNCRLLSVDKVSNEVTAGQKKRSDNQEDMVDNVDISIKNKLSTTNISSKPFICVKGLRPDSKEFCFSETEPNYVNGHPNWLQPSKLTQKSSSQRFPTSSSMPEQDLTHTQHQNIPSLLPTSRKQLPPQFEFEPRPLTLVHNSGNENENGNTIVNDGKRFGQRTDSVSNKGRVITTVLLDNVQNPPQIFQCNKVPPLSTLAWNCGEESNQSWSKVVPPSKSKPPAAFTNQVGHGSNGEQRRTPPDAGFMASTTLDHLSLSQRSGGNNIGKSDTQKFSNTCMPMGFDAEKYMHEGSNFSTLLINRILQRSQTRNPPCILDIPVTKNYSRSDETYMTSQFHGNKHSSNTAQSSQSKDNEKRYVNSKIQNPCYQPSLVDPQTQSCVQNQFQQTTEAKSKANIQYFIQNENEMLNKIQGAGYSTKKTAEKQEFEEHLGTGSHILKPSDRQCPNRPIASPPVLFPEKIRDSVHPSNVCGDTTFPAFHDVETSDFLSEMFSDPLFSDKIAINQIRQKILFSHANQGVNSEVSLSASHDIDLDYYASLYRMKFRDVLSCPPARSPLAMRTSKDFTLISGHKINSTTTCKEGKMWQNNSCQLLEKSLMGDSQQSWPPSARWFPVLQKILDLPWTTRRQYDDILLPDFVQEFSIGMAGDVLINLGYLMDGSEVAVFMLFKRCQYMSPRMVEIIGSAEMDKHFLVRCRSYSESSDVQYIATNLFEYTLCEYLQICLSDCSHNIAAYNGPVWQMLQALAYLHHGIGIAHGYLAPDWVFIDMQGHIRLAGFGIERTGKTDERHDHSNQMRPQGNEFNKSSCWMISDDANSERTRYTFTSDIYAAGMLAYYILTHGQYQFGTNPLENDIGSLQDRLGLEAFDLICPMLAADPKARPTVDQCLRHPLFWSGDKKFRLILIVGSDVLTEMKTGVALTGSGAPTMMEILSMVDISIVSPNWIHEVDSTVLKEMRSFRVYKNNLAELTLFVYNCCLHFDKLSNVAKEILDDPSKYFQNLFPSLFLAIYRSLKGSDRSDRTCYKPFF